MRRQMALIMIFTLLFSAIFNIGPGGALTVNAASDELKLDHANIENREEDVYAYEVFELEFNEDIKRNPKKYGEIELYNRDSSKSEDVKVTIDGNTLIIEPVKRMEYSARYRLLIEEEYIVTDDKFEIPLEKDISFYFTVEDDYWGDDDDDDEDRDYALRGKTYGVRFGKIEGQLSGYMDSLDGKKNNWSKAIPTNKKIINEYNLSKETTEYRNAFLLDFRDNFKKEYEEAFRDENFKDPLTTKESALIHGGNIGSLEGDVYGKLDYIGGKKNNWESRLPSDSVIIEKYNLNRETPEYRESFLKGYTDSFRDSYNLAFWEENMDIAEGGLYTEFISMSGGYVSSHDGIMTLKIEAGSFYEEAGISIEKASLYGNFLGTAMTQATHSYNVKVQNLLNSVNLKKPIRIEFDYYGPKEGGIYEFKNGRWTYLYSQFEGDKIYVDIHTNKYLGGTYAVFVDEAYKTMDDIGGHWAAKSIETFLRRNYISGYPDRTFRPDQSITRAEIVKILDDVYGWSMYSPYTHASINFKDSSIFGVFASSISKAVSLGYVKGHTDNTFRPHIPITYQEVEWLMQRITGRQDFKWYTVAEKISKDYFVRSKSYNSKDNYITRAEVVYLLHSLEEGLI